MAFDVQEFKKEFQKKFEELFAYGYESGSENGAVHRQIWCGASTLTTGFKP